MSPSDGLIVVVGPCASGKTTLVRGLRDLGWQAKSVAQEHSYVPYLWRRQQPAFLVVLDVQWETAKQRRPEISYGPDRYAEQRRRLAHARAHCDLFLPTDGLSIEEVRRRVVEAVQAQ